MNERENKIDQLTAKLEELSKRQGLFQRDIDALKEELDMLRYAEPSFKPQAEQPLVAKAPEVLISAEPPKVVVARTITPPVTESAKAKKVFNLEKFIGENLINKIGIAVLVIGVAIGAKYAIEHQLISPLTRIILGYLMGLGLLGVAIRLKKNYESFSAVILSGAMAILYFITFAAYSIYHLLPQELTFAIMVMLTTFTVFAALKYSMQVIAHIGLVGAYAVPFLLSKGEGKVAILFSYMAIINAGILVIGFRKYWKALYYSSFAITWLIYMSWIATKYDMAQHFGLALTFLAIFFAIFYTTFLAYKLKRLEKFVITDVGLLLLNSFLFFGFGYGILVDHPLGGQLLGIFTVINALIHFGVCTVIYRLKLADRNMFYLMAGLVLTFITIAIPVQLNGSWVTLVWAGEAALLFWIGRTKNVTAYEWMSYPLIILAFISILQDWQGAYGQYMSTIDYTPVFNINVLTAMLFVAAMGFIIRINHTYQGTQEPNGKGGSVFIAIATPAIMLIVLYSIFSLEISEYWNRLYASSAIELKEAGLDYAETYYNNDLGYFRTIWQIIYSFAFFSILALVNIRWFKRKSLGYVSLVLFGYALLLFLFYGLYILSELRDSYIHKELGLYFKHGGFNVGIRYIALALLGVLYFSIFKLLKEVLQNKALRVTYDIVLFTSIWWIASSELINLMDLFYFENPYRLALSIMWGIMALLFIIWGISKKRKHIRILAIAVAGITLIKLFAYDMSHFDTIAKTLAFVSLGILLLVISFLYNKYKHFIFDDNDTNP
ncbi:DUF2339 domain-containing protein [Williamwhitmania taraxaci]|uniref:Predicted membrane protein n=1 Tax=Williamwhitmania taraxaci TaxID=1640674 RepID=A0A1G6H3F7_9BACT|nr:DUF2339 domain-containing protein [Williamwhitmania taraxaci]SDB88809.1 Predicted membrane protein [Williamwhitmania taraxaci]